MVWRCGIAFTIEISCSHGLSSYSSLLVGGLSGCRLPRLLTRILIRPRMAGSSIMKSAKRLVSIISRFGDLGKNLN